MKQDSIISANKMQTISETDAFTLKRYGNFLKYFTDCHKTVLDFGCNTGRRGGVLKKEKPYLQIFGADIIKERLEQIPQGIYEKVVDLNIHELSDALTQIDVIVSGEVVEHIPLYDLISYLKSFYDMLPNGGLLLLTTPNPHSWLVKLGRKAVFRDPSHINLMDINFLETLLSKLGFSSVKIKGSGKAVNLIGENFPFINIYGSYMVIATK